MFFFQFCVFVQLVHQYFFLNPDDKGQKNNTDRVVIKGKNDNLHQEKKTEVIKMQREDREREAHESKNNEAHLLNLKIKKSNISNLWFETYLASFSRIGTVSETYWIKFFKKYIKK